MPAPPKIKVSGLSIGYPDRVIQHDLSFSVASGAIFAIMGGSGCGKSTLLKAMIGLLRPTRGRIDVDDDDYWGASDARRTEIGRRFGVLFQGGALWSGMSTADNVALPLRMLTALDEGSIGELVRLKLSLVGLENDGDVMPDALSGGMRKRAGLARALALDPEILFFDEPSAGLDPIAARRLDDLIVDLRDGFGVTVVMVSHELSSLLGICDSGIFLDADRKTAIAHGAPRALLESCDDPTVKAFMNRARVPLQPDPAGVAP